MTRDRLILALMAMIFCVSSAKAGALDPPSPEVFARPEDQERARLLGTPCTEADVGHGCYRSSDRLVREAPCAYHIDDSTIGLLPVDQCFKMEAPRRYRGVWIDEFEGQAFIPEGEKAPEWPGSGPETPGWHEKFERARASLIWIDVEHAGIGHDYRNGRREMLIEFVGRKTMYPGAYGQFGLFGNEIVVDRVISLKKAE